MVSKSEEKNREREKKKREMRNFSAFVVFKSDYVFALILNSI